MYTIGYIITPAWKLFNIIGWGRTANTNSTAVVRADISWIGRKDIILIDVVVLNCKTSATRL